MEAENMDKELKNTFNIHTATILGAIRSVGQHLAGELYEIKAQVKQEKATLKEQTAVLAHINNLVGIEIERMLGEEHEIHRLIKKRI